jgi:DNA-binding transcriptional regulator YdaS (Cro superfamily)
MHEDEPRQLPVVVDLMTAATVLGVGRTPVHEMGTRLEAVPASRVSLALLTGATRGAVGSSPGAPRVHGGRGA